MGLIRGGLFVIASVLLFIALLVGNLFLTLNKSLEYENIQEKLPSLIRSYAEEQFRLTATINREFPTINAYCQNNSEYVFNEYGRTFIVPCGIVSQGPELIVENEINRFVEETYYKDYNCNFWNCFKETEIPFFLVSEKAKNYWNEKFYFTLTA